MEEYALVKCVFAYESAKICDVWINTALCLLRLVDIILLSIKYLYLIKPNSVNFTGK